MPASSNFTVLHEDDALGRDGPSDFVLREGHTSAWVTVDNLSVYIVRTDEGVAVDIFPKGEEMDGAIAGTYAFNNEGSESHHYRE